MPKLTTLNKAKNFLDLKPDIDEKSNSLFSCSKAYQSISSKNFMKIRLQLFELIILLTNQQIHREKVFKTAIKT